MKKKSCFCILSAVLLCSVCHGALSFNMTPKAGNPTTISIGEETTIVVSAYDTGAVADYGLVEWGFDMWLAGSSTGSVEVVSGTILDEGLYDFPEVSGENTIAGEGSITIGTLQFSPPDPVSQVGVGGYVPIAEIVIRGTVAGDAVYALGTLTEPTSFFGRVRDGVSEEAAFDSASAVTTYTVVPEPASLLILCGLSVLGVGRRKK